MSWADPSRYIERIQVEESCLTDDYCQAILRRAALPWTVFCGEEPPRPETDAVTAWRAAKTTLALRRYKGRFFKRSGSGNLHKRLSDGSAPSIA